MLILAIDPGKRSGAACLRNGPVVERWCTWVYSQRQGRIGVALRQSDDPRQRLPRAMADVGDLLASWGPVAYVVLEGLFAKNQSSITLAEACGEMMGPIRRLGWREVRPRAVERGRASRGEGWRRLVLDLPDLRDGDRAEEDAVAWAEGKGKSTALPCPRWLVSPFTRPSPLLAVELGALAEAAAMSCYPLGAT